MKWFLKLIVALLLIIIVVLAVVLVPAHIQVRSVEPDLPSLADLSSVASKQGPSRLSYILTSTQAGQQRDLSHISIVVEWANGQMFVIDTGMSQTQALEFAALLKKMDSTLQNADVKGTVSSILGSKLDAVAGVGFTHLHIDHIEGTKEFCDLRGEGPVVLQTPSQRTLQNFNTSEGAAIVADSCLAEAQFKPMVTNDNLFQSPLFPGLAAVELGGHTPGSTLWVVTLGEQVYLFSGDTTNDKRSLDYNVAKEAVYSWLIVPENIERTAYLRTWLAQADKQDRFHVVVSHDLANTQAVLSEFVEN